ncbi:Reticulocyte-binding protein 2-like protein a [Colletotrichum shisoi]|uniref:Reticulocyte-binding protein 2-like protein a n=1 Tax=Colletotrichum shisoi TaxID=2078593 RepID=A0A5Q4BFG5_9PEZI|nr:Reticulocyte-binding protein 2-like protein a [Colletotrichum shisoi]
MAKQTFARVLVSPRVRPRTVLFLVFAVVLIHFYLKGLSSFGGQPGFWHHAAPNQPPENPADEQTAVPAARPTPHVENSLAIWHPPKKNKEDTQRKGEKEVENEEAASKKEAEALKQEEEALKQEEESLKYEAEALKQTEEQRKQQEDQLKHKEEEHEQKLRDDFAREYEAASKLPGSGAIYGNTIKTLTKSAARTSAQEARLRSSSDEEKPWANHRPVHFNPYPDYNGEDWKQARRAKYVPCVGATGELVEDILVFKGRPARFPKPLFGSFDIFEMDGNLCYERETRLGPYGYVPQLKENSHPVDWDYTDWGSLQEKCVKQNAARFGPGKPNRFIDTAYSKDGKKVGRRTEGQEEKSTSGSEATGSPAAESRTAVLLRTFTGKRYTENDKQAIRSLISELSLRSGGEYQVFLLLHVHDRSVNLQGDKTAYQHVLDEHVPLEFHGITKLWNDQMVWDIYTALTEDDEKSVHHAQWLSVQKFSMDHPEFDYIWNWEMDVRVVGHNYDLLERLREFSKNQPRRGLWERNERYYIPNFHGSYTDFRDYVEQQTHGSQVWGPPKVPFINPVGPKPPTKNPRDDPFSWGVGEEADLITLGPIFNPVNSSWIFADHIWGYRDKHHPATSLPRRCTIVTQSRISKRLLDIMHVENLRGNHIASEMTPQTVALLHGLKAVFAPHPTWFDRPWNGTFLNKWFNPGPNGESGGLGSAMGYGRERRYQGITWYYRAEPPSRLYNNWMGYMDTDIGGQDWEITNGRPCLPPMILHPIKDVNPTGPGFATKFELFYG